MGKMIDEAFEKLGYMRIELHNAITAQWSFELESAKSEMERYIASSEGFRVGLMEALDKLAAKELELSTLRNKIVERAQVPSTLKAKTSADVRRIVEQANEAEFEEQANGKAF